MQTKTINDQKQKSVLSISITHRSLSAWADRMEIQIQWKYKLSYNHEYKKIKGQKQKSVLSISQKTFYMGGLHRNTNTVEIKTVRQLQLQNKNNQ